ncbi:hypothetical protein BU15DRAFT_67588 [Melanogaster broomeanus]|nr:hypothetical protein BU15DRAFT_67588 [Melanogaster broomeanus]
MYSDYYTATASEIGLLLAMIPSVYDRWFSIKTLIGEYLLSKPQVEGERRLDKLERRIFFVGGQDDASIDQQMDRGHLAQDRQPQDRSDHPKPEGYPQYMPKLTQSTHCRIVSSVQEADRILNCHAVRLQSYGDSPSHIALLMITVVEDITGLPHPPPSTSAFNFRDWANENTRLESNFIDYAAIFLPVLGARPYDSVAPREALRIETEPTVDMISNDAEMESPSTDNEARRKAKHYPKYVVEEVPGAKTAMLD